mgnify:CR=1 FL=1
MKRPRYKSKYAVREADTNVQSIIDELIGTKWSGSNEGQMKAVQLLKGLATSDDPAANKFMQKLDQVTSGLDPKEFSEQRTEAIDKNSSIIKQIAQAFRNFNHFWGVMVSPKGELQLSVVDSDLGKRIYLITVKETPKVPK